ncbi:fumarylacetoacetate hydrolase family protein [Neobacillus sp. MM2021_6]|uniref:fumarylacetoacetate hydrolase family protein n=1 Tax=Bacillaceae TaxID=186817 RepID=UPI00140AAFFD|nr:fumarylacetoacetate hydrolase family protein [Neobacillus sp. MM2021_6]NHC20877.1 fumarylacetoacetate hydrolase family protein [Bacillus sp. MM2020_4]
MKFVTFAKKDGSIRAGWLADEDHVVDMKEASGGTLPDNLVNFLDHSEEFMKIVNHFNPSGQTGIYRMSDIQLKAPLPIPRSFRDFYAFEQHVKTARENRGQEMIPEWYEIPVFYFSNHLAIKGPEEGIVKPKECEWLDYELEIACVIGKEGRDIPRDKADEYIFGYCILNDWSARDLQRKEMKVGLGPAKGKDFSTSIGPWIVTKDELKPFKAGNGFNLSMHARVNGILLSEGNMKDLYYSFAEMIARASQDVTLYPGEMIGSGTVGTGCILELGEEIHRWLEPGDEVELEIEQIGVLKNTIITGNEEVR